MTSSCDCAPGRPAATHSSCAARAAASAMTTPAPNWGPIRLLKIGANAARVDPATDHGADLLRQWDETYGAAMPTRMVVSTGEPGMPGPSSDGRRACISGCRTGRDPRWRGHGAGARGCCLSGRRADRRRAGQQAKPGCRGENDPAESRAPVRRGSFFRLVLATARACTRPRVSSLFTGTSSALCRAQLRRD
jgi:hypothetical protein